MLLLAPVCPHCLRSYYNAGSPYFLTKKPRPECMSKNIKGVIALEIEYQNFNKKVA